MDILSWLHPISRGNTALELLLLTAGALVVANAIWVLLLACRHYLAFFRRPEGN